MRMNTERQMACTERKKHEQLLKELNQTMKALHRNEMDYREAVEQFAVERLIYEHAALVCRCRAVLNELKGR